MGLRAPPACFVGVPIPSLYAPIRIVPYRNGPAAHVANVHVFLTVVFVVFAVGGSWSIIRVGAIVAHVFNVAVDSAAIAVREVVEAFSLMVEPFPLGQSRARVSIVVALFRIVFFLVPGHMPR